MIIGTIICELGTIMYDIGTFNMRFYLLELSYPHGYYKITPFCGQYQYERLWEGWLIEQSSLVLIPRSNQLIYFELEQHNT